MKLKSVNMLEISLSVQGGVRGCFHMNILAMIFGWLNDQLLKMRWLSELVRLLVEKVFGLSVSERIGGSIHFFYI